MANTPSRSQSVNRFRMPDGAILDVPLATGFRGRALGLIGRKVRPGDALLLRRCSSVHTWLMRSPIDVLFLDEDDRVLRVVPALRPWRFAACRHAKSVLELAAGEAGKLRLQPGEPLILATDTTDATDVPGTSGASRSSA